MCHYVTSEKFRFWRHCWLVLSSGIASTTSVYRFRIFASLKISAFLAHPLASTLRSGIASIASMYRSVAHLRILALLVSVLLVVVHCLLPIWVLLAFLALILSTAHTEIYIPVFPGLLVMFDHTSFSKAKVTQVLRPGRSSIYQTYSFDMLNVSYSC